MTSQSPVKPDATDDLAAALAEANVAACLQCRKCTSGCPVAGRADVKPHELVRLVQLGQRSEVLASRMIWECTSCQTCITRCPQKVDIAAMNDELRRISRSERKEAAVSAVATFNEIFLRAIERRGRIYEMGLMASFKLRTRRFFADVNKLPMMLLKGKLPLLPKSVADHGQRKAMFKRIAQTGGKRP